MKAIIPQTAQGKFILFSFLISTLAAISHQIYISNIDILTLSRSQSYVEYLLRVIRDIALSCALATMIIDGIRVVRREGLSLKRISKPIAGGLICFLFVMVAWSAQYRMRELNIMLTEDKKVLERTEKMLPELMKNPIENSEKIYLLARMKYKLDGKQIKYPNRKGEFMLYQPSEEERNRFEEMEKTKRVTKRTEYSLKSAFYLWVALLVTSTIIGLISPIKRINRNNMSSS